MRKVHCNEKKSYKIDARRSNGKVVARRSGQAFRRTGNTSQLR